MAGYPQPPGFPQPTNPDRPPGVAIIGEGAKVRGFGLPGATVLPAEGPEEVWAAWRSLAPEVAIVVLTSRAARTLATERRSWPLTVVMPP